MSRIQSRSLERKHNLRRNVLIIDYDILETSSMESTTSYLICFIIKINTTSYFICFIIKDLVRLDY